VNICGRGWSVFFAFIPFYSSACFHPFPRSFASPIFSHKSCECKAAVEHFFFSTILRGCSPLIISYFRVSSRTIFYHELLNFSAVSLIFLAWVHCGLAWSSFSVRRVLRVFHFSSRMWLSVCLCVPGLVRVCCDGDECVTSCSSSIYVPTNDPYSTCMS